MSPVDDLYLKINIVLGYAREQIRKHMACMLCSIIVIGVACVVNKMQCLLCLWSLPNDLKRNESNFSTISTDTVFLLKIRHENNNIALASPNF